ncbi:MULTISPECIES: MFS transporter [unclassified Variovorax]|uniref:MFS transporter n=1 Tax=unclassified Variovorax TaxID=663243 RepID=UPI0008CA71B4|nr:MULTISPECIES: MFS transporter [unclassified Variovorax]SEK16157.1 Predicted arabinose efflux permease, MFS family [Variovorax sp. OK202]SFE35540.1 Predicted arabinose efflux permease, MFS family [Variovorax sp. OK212]
MISRPVAALLNIGHAVDHMFLLIFATAVSAIATDFGFERWEDLMPYGVGAFFVFGLGSLPSGRLGDLWGRRSMMVLFFFGMGAAALLASITRSAWEMAGALTLIGLFASIYHPVGIPMLLQQSARPGATIGLNGLVGNLGIAVAAALTGLLVKWLGWRAAFAVPGLVSIAVGFVFVFVCPPERESPAKRPGGAAITLPAGLLARALAIMTAAAATSSLLFNFTTNGNAQLLTERLRGVAEDPALLGALLGSVYAVASLAQLVVGRLIDRMPLKPLYMGVTLAQVPLLLLASQAQGWWLYGALLCAMTFIFGAIPFTDAMIVRYVDDRIRSRVAGMRLAVSLSVSSLAVWMLGPVVKGMGFGTLLCVLAAISLCTAAVVGLLPREHARETP